MTIPSQTPPFHEPELVFVPAKEYNPTEEGTFISAEIKEHEYNLGLPQIESKREPTIQEVVSGVVSQKPPPNVSKSAIVAAAKGSSIPKVTNEQMSNEVNRAVAVKASFLSRTVLAFQRLLYQNSSELQYVRSEQKDVQSHQNLVSLRVVSARNKVEKQLTALPKGDPKAKSLVDQYCQQIKEDETTLQNLNNRSTYLTAREYLLSGEGNSAEHFEKNVEAFVATKVADERARLYRDFGVSDAKSEKLQPQAKKTISALPQVSRPSVKKAPPNSSDAPKIKEVAQKSFPPGQMEVKADVELKLRQGQGEAKDVEDIVLPPPPSPPTKEEIEAKKREAREAFQSNAQSRRAEVFQFEGEVSKLTKKYEEARALRDNLDKDGFHLKEISQEDPLQDLVEGLNQRKNALLKIPITALEPEEDRIPGKNRGDILREMGEILKDSRRDVLEEYRSLLKDFIKDLGKDSPERNRNRKVLDANAQRAKKILKAVTEEINELEKLNLAQSKLAAAEEEYGPYRLKQV